MGLKKDLSYFDLTNIVVGSIIGSDIYIASAITAGLVGPFSLVVWFIAAIAAVILASVFAYCSFYVPRVGGSFAFVSEAFDDFYGFLTGWSLWIAELLALPVFAITFTNYLHYFIQLDFWGDTAVKALFLFGLTFVNIVGVKAAGKLNDFLTIVKLFPLLLIIVFGFALFAGNPASFAENYTPLMPFGLDNFGTALVLIFWAYVGFELGTLPAGEVKNPRKTIPKAIITGISIVTVFYMLTNFVVFGTVGWQTLTSTTTPLILVGSILLGTMGAALMSTGAMVSVSGSDASGILGTSRLSYAMAIDGLFPKIFSKIHRKYKTPYMALIIQCIIAFMLSLFAGVANLISFSVFNLGFSFLLTCLALVVLKKEGEKKLYGQDVIPLLGIIVCLYLIYSTSMFDKIVGSAVIALGIPLYVFFSPKTDIHHLKKLFTSEEAILERRLERKERFLANFMRIVHRIFVKLRR
ncbi:MAG: amino acid permease [Candidatus Aenigmarchaeota archaeon]|nr:amino acid permease [Candidatus Aenigmarchaeota archaeon]